MTEVNLKNISEVRLIYQRKVKAEARPSITNSQTAYDLFRQKWDDLTINLYEEFKILLLDRNNRCMGLSTVSIGGVSGTVVDPKLVFITALKTRACGLIVAHNHPSGNLKASNADVRLTKQLKEAGKLLDLPLLDHLIVTDEHYISMSDEGLIP